MTHGFTIEEFIASLKDLDRELQGEHIIIRAVGGFALAWHHIRENGLTIDIDTVTDDYPDSVIAAIERVAVKRGLDKWWLNNDVAADDAEFLNESLALKWEIANLGFKNIVLYVADRESLLSLKLAALEDRWLSGRKHDLDDAIRLLIALGYTKNSFQQKMAYISLDQPHAYKAICSAVW